MLTKEDLVRRFNTILLGHREGYTYTTGKDLLREIEISFVLIPRERWVDEARSLTRYRTGPRTGPILP